MEELKRIILEIRDIEQQINAQSEDGCKFSSDVILDCATRIFNTRKMNGNGAIRPQETKMASSKQKDFMKKHTSIDTQKIDGMTSREASGVIEEVMKKWNN